MRWSDIDACAILSRNDKMAQKLWRFFMKEIELIVGGLYLTLGISLTIQKNFWTNYIEKIYNEPHLLVALGLPALLLGLSIVSFHNIWVWDVPVLVTIVGWVLVFKYFLFFVAPDSMLSFAKRRQLSLSCFRCYGVFAVVASLFILYSACPLVNK